MKYSLIVLNRNGLAFVERFFASIEQTIGRRDDCEIIFVDNASSDGSREFAANHVGLPVRMIENAENVSYSAGNNLGARIAQGRYLIFANNDLEFSSHYGPYVDWIDAMQGAYDENIQLGHAVGCVGAKLLYPPSADHMYAGMVQHAGITFERDHVDSFFVPKNYGKGEDQHVFGGVRQCSAVTAALMFMPKEKFDSVKGFDEHYFYNFEDVDLCLRLGEQGNVHVVQNDLTIYHHESVSQKKQWDDEHGRKIHESALFFKRRWNELLATLMYPQRDTKNDLYAQQGLYAHLLHAEDVLSKSNKEKDGLLLENHLLRQRISDFEESLSPTVLALGKMMMVVRNFRSKVAFAIFHPVALVKKYTSKKN